MSFLLLIGLLIFACVFVVILRRVAFLQDHSAARRRTITVVGGMNELAFAANQKERGMKTRSFDTD